jgi:hypothetical protein
MKIISKFKDYYDFAAGFDTDPRKIYVRKPVQNNYDNGKEFPRIPSFLVEDKTKKLISISNNSRIYFIGGVWFCDKYYPYLYSFKDDKYYYTLENIPPVDVELFNKHKEYVYSENSRLDRHFNVWEFNPKKEYARYRFNSFRIDHEEYLNSKMNTLFGSPVIFSQPPGIKIKDGLLQDVKFGQIKTSQQAYMELYNWIPYIEPDMPSDPTDMQRFEGKGHDKKTSFRKPKQ